MMDDIHWFAGLGVSKPMSTLSGCCDIGFNLIGGAEYTVMPGWAARGELGFGLFGGRGSVGSASEAGALVSGVYSPTMWSGYTFFGEIRYVRSMQSGQTAAWIPLTVGIRF